jgi:hypothetical protein
MDEMGESGEWGSIQTAAEVAFGGGFEMKRLSMDVGAP